MKIRTDMTPLLQEQELLFPEKLREFRAFVFSKVKRKIGGNQNDKRK
jgi:hypothetical protein